jgi:N-acetylmuramoyl-L-alanine amidase
LDPGHSGRFEPGACAGGVTEAELTYLIARFAKHELKQRGHEAILTRSREIDNDELAFRAETANQWNADLFISIHCNSAVDPAAEGTETYYFPGSVRGRELARRLQLCLTDAMLTEDRGIKEGNFQVLRETKCPAALVECAFLHRVAAILAMEDDDGGGDGEDEPLAEVAWDGTLEGESIELKEDEEE